MNKYMKKFKVGRLAEREVAALRAKLDELEQAVQCPICMDNRPTTAFLVRPELFQFFIFINPSAMRSIYPEEYFRRFVIFTVELAPSPREN